MPAENTIVVDEQAGNGVKTVYSISDMKIYAETDLVVRKSTALAVYGAALTLDTDYTVEFDSDEDTITVTFTVAPVNGGTAWFARLTPLTQGSEFPREDKLPAKTLQNVVDRLTLQVQELSERMDRAPQLLQYPAEPAQIVVDAPTTLYYLKWYYNSSEGKWHIVPSAT